MNVISVVLLTVIMMLTGYCICLVKKTAEELERMNCDTDEMTKIERDENKAQKQLMNLMNYSAEDRRNEFEE